MTVSLISPYLANDKFVATLRSTWIHSPADASLLVNAIPTNVPTIVVVGYGTDSETVFSVTGTSGTDASNYALTGVTRIKGANIDLPELTAVNCLNNEEFFNQYGSTINDVIETVNAGVPNAGWVTVTDGATMLFDLASGANRRFKTTLTTARTFTIANSVVGTTFIVRITQPASARVVTWFTGFTISWQGTDGATATAIGNSKTGTYGFTVTGASTLDGFFMGAES